MKLRIEKSVCVITPTIGTKYLAKCVDSVERQTYKNIKHLVVVDGTENFHTTLKSIDISNSSSKLSITSTPVNTGGGGYNGQRIYAAYPHLLNEDYILFLDEDNWYEPNHVESLVDTIEKNNYDWAYSLRNICSENGKFIVEDCCESIGEWPIFWSLDKPEKQHIVDTSAYCFTRDFIKNTCHLWHSGVWGEDRRYFNAIRSMSKFGTTGQHTMNYRLDDKIEQKYGSLDFFIKGNEAIKQYYGGYPWQKI